MKVAAFLFCVVAILSPALAQKAVRVDVRSGAAAGSNAPALAPEQGVVIEPRVSWLPAADWDGNTPPDIYGYDPLALRPKFTLVSPNARTMWIYRPFLPVDLQKYPILKFKYRATNYNKQAENIFRLVQGTRESASVVNVFTGEDITPDNREHELTKDLRELKVTEPLKTIGIWLASAEQSPATLEIVELSFLAPEDAKPEKLKDDGALKVMLTDDQDKPLAGAKVTVDAERLNYARTAMTDANGQAALTPLANEAEQHSLRVEKSGIVTIERGAIAGKQEEPLKLKATPASFFGGVAKSEDGRPLPRAMVTLLCDKEWAQKVGHELVAHLVTDSTGRWMAGPFPDDAAQTKITAAYTDPNGGATASIDLDAATLKRAAPSNMNIPITVARATTRPSNSSSSSNTAVSTTPPKPATKPAPGAAVTIQKVDDTTISGTLGAMVDGHFTVATNQKSAGPVKLPMADVAEITFTFAAPSGSPSAARISALIGASTRPGDAMARLKSCRMELMNGDRLAGELSAWSDRKVTFRFDGAAAAMPVPIEQVRELWCASQEQIAKAKALKEISTTEDIAYAMKDDQIIAVRGVAVGVVEGSLEFRLNNEDRKLPLARFLGVVLAHPDLDQNNSAFEQVIQLAGSDQAISGQLKSIEKGQLTLETPWSETVKLPLDKVAKIQCRNGRLTYLSDLKPSSVEQVPFFDRLLTYKLDKSLDGKPLVLSDGTYTRGIAVHSRCRLTYDLGGKFDELRTKVGFQQPEGKLGDAVIRVTGDGKVLFEKTDARGDQPPVEVKAPVSGVQKLVLEVDYGKNQDVADRVVWANARVIRSAQ